MSEQVNAGGSGEQAQSQTQNQGQAGGETTPAQNQGQPQLIEGKWKDVNEVVKSYNALKSQFDKVQSAMQSGTAPKETPSSVPSSSQSNPSQAQSKNLIKEAAREFSTSGDLSEGTLNDIAKALGTDMNGAKLIAKTFQQDLSARQADLAKQVSDAGVKMSPSDIVKEAGKYYTAEQLDIIAKATDAGMYDLFLGMAKTVQSKAGAPLHKAEHGETGGASSVDGFKDIKEMNKALSSTKMDTDGDYFRSTMAKLSATDPSLQELYRTGGRR